MGKRMTDERLAEIESDHDLSVRMGATTIAHNGRAELLQALKAERRCLRRSTKKLMEENQKLRKKLEAHEAGFAELKALIGDSDDT